MDNYKKRTSWTVNNETVTLGHILSTTKHIPITKCNVKDLIKVVIDLEIDAIRMFNADLSYPIIVIASERGEYRCILDGNHRVQKAIITNLSTIDAKVIKIKDLSDKAKRVLSHVAA